jgi:DNA-directed RNA polymerase II subunit RPB9
MVFELYYIIILHYIHRPSFPQHSKNNAFRLLFESYKQRSILIHTFVPPSQEDKRTRTLMYACRLCRHTETASDQPLIYRFDLKKEVGNILHTVPSAVSDDPTLARSQNANCANCGHNEAVFFMSDSTQNDSLALIFVCCNCDYKWVN